MLTETQQKIIELLQSGDQANIDMVLNWSEEVTGFDHIQWIEDIFGILLKEYYDYIPLNQKIFKLFKQKAILLDEMNLNEIPYWLQYLTSVERLWIDNNHITIIPTWITKLKNLKLISLDGNPISELPECFGQLINLNNIYLENTKLEILPDFFRNFNKLEFLDVRGTKITEIPQFLSDIETMETLCIPRCLNKENYQYWHSQNNIHIECENFIKK